MKTRRIIALCIALCMLLSLAAFASGEARGASGSPSGETAFSVVNLKTDGKTDPVGIDDTAPRFSWQMASDAIGAAQTAYQIVVTDDSGAVVWDSGKVESAASYGIPYGGEALAAKTRYQWTVSVTDENGAVQTSAPAFFETTFLDGGYDAWGGAEWIGAAGKNFDAASACLFDLEMTVRIPEGNTRASVVFGASDFRLQNAAMNVWNRATENNYFQYEIDISDPDAPKLNIYVVGMPTRVPELDEAGNPVKVTSFFGEMDSIIIQETENDPAEPDITVDIPAEVFAEAGLHGEITVGIKTPGINTVTCTMNGVTVDGSRCLNPLGNSHDYNSFPNLNSIGFAVPENETAEYSGVVIRYFNSRNDPELNGIHFDKNTGAAYAIFEGLDGVTVSDAEDLITVSGGRDGKPVYADPSFDSAPMLRTEFGTAGKAVESARLYVACQGSYEATVNGVRVSDGWFNPGNEEYSTTMPYQVYDVTALLQTGKNALGAQLGQGWWSGHVNYETSSYNYYGTKQAMLARLDVTYTDGTEDTIVTNTDDWTVSIHGPVEYESHYNGERYNAVTAAAYAGWDCADYQLTADWETPVVIDPRMNDFTFAVRYDDEATVVKELSVQEALGEAKPGTGSYIYDMGENVIGVPRITIPAGYADEGDIITVRYAEILYPDLPEYEQQGLVGSMMVENLRAALCTDFFVAGAGEQVFEPHFTFHGYRYIEISGLKKELPAHCIQTEVLSSVKMTATYNSSNELVNRLFKNVQNSQTSNFLSLPTDCPQRNERLGWTGDAQVFSMAASYNADVYNFYRNWLKSLRACQRTDGSLPVYAPTAAPHEDTFSGMGFSGVSWDAALTLIPFNLYKQYGDPTIIVDNIDAIDRYLDYLDSYDMSADYPHLTSRTGMLADWLSVASTDAGLINNAVYVYLIGAARDMAQVVGRTDLYEKYAAQYELAKADWNDCYVEPGTGRMKVTKSGASADPSAEPTVTWYDTEAAYATPLRYGVVSEEYEALAVENYVKTVEEAGFTITSGFSGTPNLVPVLTKYGYIDEAYRLFEQTAYASWLYPVTQGATSVWERWNSYTVEGGFNGNNSMNSFNHFSLGAISEWMMAYQLGITTDGVGYQEFVLQPVPGGDFTYAGGSYESVYGTISSAWTAEDGALTSYEATVPANTAATLYLPITEGITDFGESEGAAFAGVTERNGIAVAQYELSSGSFRFEVADAGVTVG